MGLIEELAAMRCEVSTSREGCAHDRPPDRWCAPCRARKELGLSPEAPRECEGCGARLVDVNIAGGIPTGTDINGSHTCPPPLHRPRLFYEEMVAVDRARRGGA